MTPFYRDEWATVHHGDCLDVLAALPDCSVDAAVTDPPYGLEFMGKEWDTHPDPEAFQRWCQQWSAGCLRVLRPGGHMLAFGGTRTWHRLACAVEDAGFDIRDSIAWLYGSGFPKSLDVSKAIDKAAGAEREIIGLRRYADGTKGHFADAAVYGAVVDGAAKVDTAPTTEAAQRWQGWGTALKPAHEPIVVARKPLIGTVAHNVTEHGTGALNIDACRIGTETRINPAAANKPGGASLNLSVVGMSADALPTIASGRWPANVAFDELQAEALDRMSGVGVSRIGKPRGAASGDGWGMTATGAEYADSGGASRFFYVAKAPRSERPTVDGAAHPTVKPLTLMRWLVRLVTPPGGTVLEPFAGSGTTVEAAVLEGFRCVAIEREADYLPLIVARLHRIHAGLF